MAKKISELSKGERKGKTESPTKLEIGELDQGTAESMMSMLNQSTESESESEEPDAPESAQIELEVTEGVTGAIEEVVTETTVTTETEASLGTSGTVNPDAHMYEEMGDIDMTNLIKGIVGMIDWVHFCDHHRAKICDKVYSKTDCFSCVHHSYCKYKMSVLKSINGA